METETKSDAKVSLILFGIGVVIALGITILVAAINSMPEDDPAPVKRGPSVVSCSYVGSTYQCNVF